MTELPLINRYIIFFTYLMIPLSILGPGIIIMPQIGPITLLPHWVFMVVSIPISILLLMKDRVINLVPVVHIKNYIMFLLFWTFFGYITLLWAINFEFALKNMVLFSMLIGYILLILYSWSSLKNIKIAIALFYFIMIVNICVVFIEIKYDYHLPASGISINDIVLTGRAQDFTPGFHAVFTKGIATGTFYNSNSLSTFLSMILPIIFSFYVRSPVQKKYLRVASFIVMITGIGLLFYIHTRLAYVALSCVVIFYVFISGKRNINFIVLPLALIALIWFGIEAVNINFGILTDLFYQDQSAALRTIFYTTVIDDLLDSFLFLGKGFGAYPFDIHNWYLEIASLFGIYILALYCIFIIMILKNLYSIYKKTNNVELRYLSEGLLAANISYSVSCIADSSRLLGYDFWIIVAMSLVLMNFYRSEHDKCKDANIRGN